VINLFDFISENAKGDTALSTLYYTPGEGDRLQSTCCPSGFRFLTRQRPVYSVKVAQGEIVADFIREKD